GCEDGNKLVKPAAYVVLKNNVNSTPQVIEDLRQHLQSKLAAYKCPQSIEVIQELPKTATGKIQRYKLRQLSSSPSGAAAK
ncbi:MAG TPA: hypothetical protein VE133_17525, partial [Candidatus Sulfotelmatobacter sp.]|nr:hypothetical protein [Candidatus Sulfotelmatobacter sp.]